MVEKSAWQIVTYKMNPLGLEDLEEVIGSNFVEPINNTFLRNDFTVKSDHFVAKLKRKLIATKEVITITADCTTALNDYDIRINNVPVITGAGRQTGTFQTTPNTPVDIYIRYKEFMLNLSGKLQVTFDGVRKPTEEEIKNMPSACLIFFALFSLLTLPLLVII